MMTSKDLQIALDRLAILPDQIGHIPDEVAALLKAMLHERDTGAERISRFLREVTK